MGGADKRGRETKPGAKPQLSKTADAPAGTTSETVLPEEEELEAYERAELQELEAAGTREGWRKRLTPEQRREILDQLFFEGTARVPYIWQFYSLSSLSAIIATAGLILPSTAVVIGAMLISPLMTPILGISASIIMGWPKRAARVAGRLIAGTAVVFMIGYLIPLAFRYPKTMRLTDEILGRTNPEIGDLMVALCAGTAAAYMMVRKEALSALPGVAIAVALVPPLCVSGILTYLNEHGLAWEAFVLYATNLAAIILTASAVLLAMGFTPRVQDWRLHFRVGVGLVLAFVLVVTVAIPLTIRTIADVSDLRDRAIVVSVIEEWIGGGPIEIVDVDVEDDLIQIRVFINFPTAALYEQRPNISAYIDPKTTITSLQARLVEALGKPVEVTLKGSFGFWRTSCPATRDCYY
nr:DUF389 domain-containing protein [Desulfuromonadales bacterium]